MSGDFDDSLNKVFTINQQVLVIPRPEHSISRSHISESALKVLYRLRKAGYESYLVGGGVRDLLLGGQPKDFDVATDALPEQVKALFGNSRIIGRRFKLVHVRYGKEIIEVATFRSHHEQAESDEHGLTEDGLILRDNVYGSLDEDAIRRDFTVNALYYNIADFSVLDFTTGMQDLKARTLRMIGDTETRLQEDPVRMLRAVRFAVKLQFELDVELQQQILSQGERLDLVPAARLFDEILKLFMSSHAEQTFRLLCQYDLFRHLFAQTNDLLDDNYNEQFVIHGLINTDKRIKADRPVTPAFLFAVLMWPAVKQQSELLQAAGHSPLQSLLDAGRDVLSNQISQIAIPKRFRQMMIDIWVFQARLAQRKGKHPVRLVSHPRFRAAYDFMLLRNQAGEELQELCDWWTRLQEVDEGERHLMCKALGGSKKKRRRRSRKKPTGPVGE